MQRRRELEMLREQALRSSGLTLPNMELLFILAIQNKDLDGLTNQIGFECYCIQIL